MMNLVMGRFRLGTGYNSDGFVIFLANVACGKGDLISTGLERNTLGSAIWNSIRVLLMQRRHFTSKRETREGTMISLA